MDDLPQMVRIDDRSVARYKGHLFKVTLTTGERVECINRGNDLFELERLSDKIPTSDGHFLRQCYVSSYPLPEVVLRKIRGDYNSRDPRFIRDMGEVIIENASTYRQDPDDADLELGSQPYYLCVIQ